MDEIRSILLIRTDRLGDLLMNVPVIQRLRQNYPEAVITVVCAQENAPLFRYHLDVNRLIGVDAGKLGTLDGKRALFSRLRKHKFDLAVLTQPDKFFHALVFILGIPRRIGFKRKWGFLLTGGAEDRKAESGRHEIDANLELVDGICAKAWNGRIDLGFDSRDREREIAVGLGIREEKQNIVFHVSTTNPEKEWPAAKFRKVIEKLLEKARYRVLLVGRSEGGKAGDEFLFDPELPFVNLIDKTPLQDLAVLLNRAQCLVSLDSGPLHLAWMQKVPVVGIFIREAPGSNTGRWGVYPRFCASRQIYKARDEISPEEVFESIESVLRESEMPRV